MHSESWLLVLSCYTSPIPEHWVVFPCTVISLPKLSLFQTTLTESEGAFIYAAVTLKKVLEYYAGNSSKPHSDTCMLCHSVGQ